MVLILMLGRINKKKHLNFSWEVQVFFGKKSYSILGFNALKQKISIIITSLRM